MNVFVCSPLSGNVEANQELARGYCRAVVNDGKNPFAPHLFYTQFLDETCSVERARGIELGARWLCLCDEVWVFGRSDFDSCSPGMQFEIRVALENSIPVRYKTVEELA